MEMEVTVPSLLSDCTKGQTRFTLNAQTLDEALRRLTETYPLLRFHLYDEAEQIRRHVLIYYNEDNIRRMEQLNVPLQPGDQLHVLQNVSGG